MRNHGEREILRMIVGIADEGGARLVAVKRSKRGHPRAIFQRSAREITVYYWASGEWHIRHKILAAARRLLSE
jgi:hypothetical protein